MNRIPIDQLIVFSAEAIIVAFLVLFLFRLRFHFGLSPLYVTLGVFQPIQVILASSIYVEIIPGVIVSPGSVIIFTASLFAVLLVYIQEDATETRKAIYGIMIANLTLTLLLFVFGIQIKLPDTLNFLEIPHELFEQNARVMLAGTIVLFADVILIILSYELIYRWIKKYLFMRIYLTLAAILIFDSIAFYTGAFYGQPNYSSILTSGIIGKLSMAVFYAAILTVYLKFFEPTDHTSQPIKDVFFALTYRQKYEAERNHGRQMHEELIHWEQIFKWAGWGVVLVNPEDNTILAANDAFIQMHGYRRDEMTGMNLSEIFAPKYRTKLSEIGLLVQEKGSHSYESIHIRKNGTTFPTLANVNLVKDSEGSLLYRAGNFQDITERKQAEKSLRKSEEKYRFLADNVSDAFWILDVDQLRLKYISPSIERIQGYTPEEFIKIPLQEIYTPQFSKLIPESCT